MPSIDEVVILEHISESWGILYGGVDLFIYSLLFLIFSMVSPLSESIFYFFFNTLHIIPTKH